MVLAPFDLKRSILYLVSSNEIGTTPLWISPFFLEWLGFTHFYVHVSIILLNASQEKNITSNKCIFWLLNSCGCGQLHSEGSFNSRWTPFYWPFSEENVLSNLSSQSSPKYPFLASRWRAFFRFPRFPHTEPCLLTRDLWKCSGVGLSNLSSHTPLQHPSEHPFHRCHLPRLPPASLSIQGAESPRWQF